MKRKQINPMDHFIGTLESKMAITTTNEIDRLLMDKIWGQIFYKTHNMKSTLTKHLENET